MGQSAASGQPFAAPSRAGVGAGRPSARGWATLAALLVAAAALLPTNAPAGPASPTPGVFTQPDGTKVIIYLRGDERFHWHEDANGYTLMTDGERFFYATLDAKGRLTSTGLLAGRDNPALAGLTPRMLPSAETIAAMNANITSAAPPVTNLRDFSTNNVVKNLVLLAKFSDHNTNTHCRPPGDYTTVFNSVGGHPVLAPTGSVRDYYYTNSYGKLVLTSIVNTAWLSLPQTLAYYGSGNNGWNAYPTNGQGLAEAAVNAAIAAGVDFGPFDTDNDGYVDALTVICSGVAGEKFGNGSNDIWSMAWSLPSDLVTGSTNGLGQPVKVSKFLITSALYGSLPSTNITRIGVITHELGHHVLGLPDLYEHAANRNGAGIGSYCLMANDWGWDDNQLRPPHLSAWCRAKIGWSVPKPVVFGPTMTANQIESSNDVWKVTNGFPAGEYLLIENRQPVGHWETSMPQGGLCIWHVDEDYSNGNTQRGFPGQANWPQNGKHFQVALLQADGNFDMERRNNDGDAGDVYHAGGVSFIGPTTLPGTDTYQNGIVRSTGILITNISASGSAMTFQAFNQSAAPVSGGSFGNALAFNGLTEYVNITNFGAIAPTNEVTVEFWVNTATVAQQSAFILEPDQTTNRFQGHVSYNNGSTFWDFGNINTAGRVSTPNPANSLTNWTHYAFVASSNGNFMRLYVNGVLTSNQAGMTPFVRGAYALQLGGNDGNFLDGQLDEFRVWNTARTAAEIAGNFRHPLAGNEPGLLLYYRFDSASGTVVSNSATATGPAYNGVLVNGADWVPSGAPADGPGTWSFSRWTGDTDSGLDPSQTLWAYLFGSSTNAGINGVTVTATGNSVSNPAVAGRFSLSGVPSVFNNHTNFLTALGGSGSAFMARNFLYGGNPGVLTVEGLTVGQFYTVTLFGCGFEAPAFRASTFASGTSSLTVEEDAFGAGRGIRASYGFVAAATNQVLSFSVANLNNATWHLYGLALSQTFVDGTTNILDGVAATRPGDAVLGNLSSSTFLLITNGGDFSNRVTSLGVGVASSNNVAWVTGAGSSWTSSSNFHVGYSGTGNQLVVSNGGTVASSNGYVGFNAGANSNLATITGAGSLWTNGGDLNVGASGSGNQLVVSNGGKVAAALWGYIGHEATASNNVAIVTGTGSLWTNGGDLNVGYAGSGNQLVVSNGGTVANATARVGYNNGASNNQVTVTGPGSSWNNSLDLRVGFFGSGNGLLIANGGAVSNTFGMIGSQTGANNNSVTVTDTGSRWINSGDLWVGETGASNRLLLTNSGSVQAANAFVGLSSGSSNNLLRVDNGTLTVTNSGGTSVLDVRRGSLLFNGGTITADKLLLTNASAGGGGSMTFNAGTLITRNATISNGADFIVGLNAGFTNATWDVRSNATPTLLANGLYLGSSAANATLLLTNGATLSVGPSVANPIISTRLGANVGVTNNLAVIAGPGSLWTNSGSLHVGDASSFNTLLVSNGGRVFSQQARLGNLVGANNNRVIVTGSNSAWNYADLFVGLASSGNLLLVTNGGQVTGSTSAFGSSTSASNNQGVVTGPGSVWTVTSSLYAGDQGSFNSLLIANGGRVTNVAAYLGFNSASSNNTVTVNGASSAWNSSGELHVGESGSANALLVTNGGTASSVGQIVLGYNVGSTGNRAVVSGTNSQLSSVGNFRIGLDGSDNQLSILAGAVVQNFAGQLGRNAGGSNNLVLVSGPGSLWSNAGVLAVGVGGNANTLVVSNGGTAVNTGGAGSVGESSSGNLALVTGPGSIWSNISTLFLGRFAGSNQLLIANGGTVVNTDASIGYDIAGSNNFATVTGAGSVWSNRSALTVGLDGAGNTVLVTNGGLMFAANAVTLGFNASSTNNRLTVAGGNLIVTNSGGTSVLDVRRGSLRFNGGTITADQLLVTNATADGGGFMSFSAGTLITRTATIDIGREFAVGTSGSSGPAVWDVRSNATPTFVGTNLTIGSNSSGNTLLVTNGATLLSTGEGRVGRVGASNLAFISGAASYWSNGSDLFVGGAGSFNRLVVSNGARVSSVVGTVGNNTAGSNNTAIVTGAGSVWSNSANLVVGNPAGGNSLLISNGGLVQATSAAVGVNSSSSNNLLQLANGTLTISNGLTVSINNTLAGSGIINGNVTNRGALLPGNPVGNLTINGNLTLAANAGMSFEIGGLIPTNQYDRVTVTNFVQFAGTLSLSLLNGFLPVSTDSFTLMTFASSAGFFANAPNGAVVQTTDGLRAFTVQYTPTSLVLTNAQPGNKPNITSITPGSNQMTIRFVSSPTNQYEVQYSSTLTNWQAVVGPTFTTNAPGSTQWIDDGSLTGGIPAARFYRVQLLP